MTDEGFLVLPAPNGIIQGTALVIGKEVTNVSVVLKLFFNGSLGSLAFLLDAVIGLDGFLIGAAGVTP